VSVCGVLLQVASLSLELSNLKRVEVTLNGELALLQQQLADTQHDLMTARWDPE